MSRLVRPPLLPLVLLLTVPLVPAGVRAEPEKEKPPRGEPAVLLAADEKYASHLTAAEKAIAAEDWPVATTLLQRLLDLPEDRFVTLKRKRDGKEVKRVLSLRAEANRLLGAMPEKGREYYALEYRAPSAEMFRQARMFGEPKLLAELMRRYLHTEAGAEAAKRLAVRHLDRGHVASAAVCFDRLLARSAADKLQPLTLFKAALAYRRAGDAERFAEVFKALSEKIKEDGLKLGEKVLTLAQVKKELEKHKPAPAPAAGEWTTFRGGPTRSEQARGGPAFLEPVWKHGTVRENQTKTWIKRARQLLAQNKQPVLAEFHPVAATVRDEKGKKVPLMIYKSHWGIHARLLKDFDDLKAGAVYWEAPLFWTLDRMVVESRYVAALNQWMNYYLNNRVRPGVLFENSITGSLSTDGVRAFAVEDLQVPPYNPNKRRGRPGGKGFDEKLSRAIQHNRLQAYGLNAGKLIWEAGGYAPPVGAAKRPLANSFFLSPPLPLGGKLYVLNERDGELRLVTLDPASGKPLAIWPLARLGEKYRLPDNSRRRTQAAHLAHADGILVCPTNAGAVLGVEPAGNSVVWVHGYKTVAGAGESDPRFGVPPPGMIFNPRGQLVPAGVTQSGWRASAPVIHGGRVVLAMPDSDAVECVRLRDGKLLWRHERREGDLYLGGVLDGKVLIVGARHCRALNLDDGKLAWMLETGAPSGVGVAAGGHYYLPLGEAVKSKEPEICVIDVKKGRIIAHTRSRKKEVPANLVFFGGAVLSQSATEVVAFPELRAKLEEMERLLGKNPKDPRGLLTRGELRLDKGDLPGAAEDFRAALGAKPGEELAARVGGQLFEVLAELTRRDFDKAEKYLKDFEALSHAPPADPKAPANERKQRREEQFRRRAVYLSTLGRGREAQGKLEEAARAYLDFLEFAGAAKMMQAPDDPALKVSPAIWVRGRLAALMEKATPQQEKQIEAEMLKRAEKK